MKTCRKVRIDGWQISNMNDVLAKGVDINGERDWQYFMDTKSALDYCDLVFERERCIGVSTRTDNKNFKFPFSTVSRFERVRNGTIWFRDCDGDVRYHVRKLILRVLF